MALDLSESVGADICLQQPKKIGVGLEEMYRHCWRTTLSHIEGEKPKMCADVYEGISGPAQHARQFQRSALARI
jgi:hypothetical protein